MAIICCYFLNWLICTKLHWSSSPKFGLMRAVVLTKLWYVKVVGCKPYMHLFQGLSSYTLSRSYTVRLCSASVCRYFCGVIRIRNTTLIRENVGCLFCPGTEGSQGPPSGTARHHRTTAAGWEWPRPRFKLGRDNGIMCIAAGPRDVIASM